MDDSTSLVASRQQSQGSNFNFIYFLLGLKQTRTQSCSHCFFHICMWVWDMFFVDLKNNFITFTLIFQSMCQHVKHRLTLTLYHPVFLFPACVTAVTMNVVCGQDSITVFVIEDFFKYYNVGLESVHLANPECRARKEVIAGVAFYTVRTPKHKYMLCGGKPIEVKMPEGGWGFCLCSRYRCILYRYIYLAHTHIIWTKVCTSLPVTSYEHLISDFTPPLLL